MVKNIATIVAKDIADDTKVDAVLKVNGSTKVITHTMIGKLDGASTPKAKDSTGAVPGVF
jgi:hypothetical protein